MTTKEVLSCYDRWVEADLYQGVDIINALYRELLELTKWNTRHGKPFSHEVDLYIVRIMNLQETLDLLCKLREHSRTMYRADKIAAYILSRFGAPNDKNDSEWRRIKKAKQAIRERLGNGSN